MTASAIKTEIEILNTASIDISIQTIIRVMNSVALHSGGGTIDFHIYVSRPIMARDIAMKFIY
jgi:hypothetical protein